MAELTWVERVTPDGRVVKCCEAEAVGRGRLCDYHLGHYHTLCDDEEVYHLASAMRKLLTVEYGMYVQLDDDDPAIRFDGWVSLTTDEYAAIRRVLEGE